MSTKLKCFVSAGEHSGDLLGANLVLAFNEMYPQVEFFGLTGQNMQMVGVKSVAEMSEVNVMGFWEVLKNLSQIATVEKRIIAAIERESPDFVVLIDFPGFHFRLAEQLKLRGFKIFQYVAPKVWAWGEKRVANLKRDFELVLGIFPFEIEYFRLKQVPFQYIGCPLKDRISKIIVKKTDFNIPSDQTVMTCLPGSRMSEITRILPIIFDIKKQLAKNKEKILYFVPVAENLDFKNMLELVPTDFDEQQPSFNWPQRDFWVQKNGIVFVKGMSLELMAIADVAIVASGTATLECALLKTPMVVVYAMNKITYKIAKKKVKIPWVSLVNILSNREVVKEFIQEFDTEEVANVLLDLLHDPEKKAQVANDFFALSESLLEDASKNAAQAIMAKVLN